MFGSRPKLSVLSSGPIGTLVLLALLLAQTQILPALIVGAAALDGGHKIECCVDAKGLKVRLGHCPAATGPCGGIGPGERHSGLLSLFVKESPDQSDHQFRFSAPSDALEDSNESGEPTGFAGDPIASALLPLAPVSRIRASHSAATHDIPPSLERLRSIVMRA